MSWIPFSDNRWGLEINYKPITIGSADSIPYEEIYSTIEEFKLTWGGMDNNYIIHFSDYRDYLGADDSALNPWNQNETYTLQTTGAYVQQIVIGDLSLAKGNDCLKFDGVNDSISHPTVQTIEAEFFFSQSSSIIGFFSGTNQLISYCNPNTNSLVIRYLDSSDTFVYRGVGVLENDAVNIVKIVIVGTLITVFTNGVETYSDSDCKSSNAITGFGLSYGEFDSLLYSVKADGVFSYIQNGDFGSPTLIDHSGNGNDGTINGATWWKQDVDENFLSPTAYRSTLLLPVENNADQNVVYTDGEPYWGTDSAEWNPWNNGTIGFTVSQQSSGSYGLQKYNYSYSYGY